MVESDQDAGLQRKRPLLEIRDLYVDLGARHGLTRGLRGINLTVHESEILGILGESGCGKSVLAQTLLRVLPRGSRIRRGGMLLHLPSEDGGRETVDLAKVRERSRQMREIRATAISLIAPGAISALSPVHTVGGQVAEAIRAGRKLSKSEAWAQAVDTLKMVGITNADSCAQEFFLDLPGSTQQRVVLAAALAGRPSLLVVDQSASAVDVTVQAQLLELVERLQGALGISVMLLSDNPAVIAAPAGRVAVMYLGSIIETGSKVGILSGAKHPYTQGLIRTVRQVGDGQRQKLWAMEGTTPPLHAHIPGCPFHPRCRHFMPGLCDVAFPETVEIRPGHTVACYLYTRHPRSPA